MENGQLGLNMVPVLKMMMNGGIRPKVELAPILNLNLGVKTAKENQNKEMNVNLRMEHGLIGKLVMVIVFKMIMVNGPN